MASEKNLRALEGKRREVAENEAILFPLWWRESHFGRLEQFREWRRVAMQVVDRSGSIALFRLLAAFDDVFSLQDCDITATDERISRAAGRCGTKTVQRGIASLKSLGLITTSPVWIAKDEKRVRGRRIRLAVPRDISGIHID
jgi:hypothetical protein